MKIRLEAYSDEYDRWWSVAWVDFVNKQCTVCTDLGASLDLPFETMRVVRPEKQWLLNQFAEWLEKHGYLDCDWNTEHPLAVDEFLDKEGGR